MYSLKDLTDVFVRIEPYLTKMIADSEAAIKSYKRRKSQQNDEELKRLHAKIVDLEAFRDILLSLRDSPSQIPRSDVLYGKTYKVKLPTNNETIYITINDQEFDGGLRPVEAFVNSKDMQSFQWITALMRMFSAVLQQPGPFPEFAIRELKETHDPQGAFFYNKKKHPSVVALIGDVIEEHCRNIGVID